MKKNKKGFFGEFKEFIMRGNVLDMAVGVVIATAFGAITKALVDKVIMPLVGLLIGGVDLAKLDITLKPAVTETIDGVETVVSEAVVLGLGSFLVTIIDFIIIAFVIFLVVKAMNKAKAVAEARKKKEEEPAPAEDPKPTTEELLAEILEEIKKK